MAEAAQLRSSSPTATEAVRTAGRQPEKIVPLLPPDTLVPMSRLQARLGDVSRSTVHKLVRGGYLPKPMHLGREGAWREGDVRALIERKAKEAQDKPRAFPPENHVSRHRKESTEQ
jgi:predicted DNA-binding transcriptional regulator AlpA